MGNANSKKTRLFFSFYLSSSYQFVLHSTKLSCLLQYCNKLETKETAKKVFCILMCNIYILNPSPPLGGDGGTCYVVRNIYK